MKKLIWFEIGMYSSFLAVYLLCQVMSMPPTSVVFVMLLFAILMFVFAGVACVGARDGTQEKLLLSCLVIYLTTLMAIVPFFPQVILAVIMLVIVILTAAELNLQFWKVFLSVVCLASAVYFPIVGFLPALS